MSLVRPNRRPSRAAKGSDVGQSGLTMVLMALPLVFSLAVAHFSGASLSSLPAVQLLQQLPSVDTLLRADSPWAELKKATASLSVAANASPALGAGAQALPSQACEVPPSRLAVLGADGPFNRDIDATLKDTKLAPHGRELQDAPLGTTLQGCVFAAHDEAFSRLTGPVPVLRRLAEKDYTFAHEGPVWLPAVNRLFFVSNRLGNLETSDQHVELWTLDPETLKTERLEPSEPLLVANGATNWSPSEVLVIQQGGNATGGALFALDVLTGRATRLLDNWQGLAFNSPNDVVVSRDGSVYFTDPSCGRQQGFRNPEQLGEYVWRWDLRSRAATVVAAGFVIPNGLVLAPDGNTLYVTDTGCLHPSTPDGGQCTSANTPRTIFAFDVQRQKDGGRLLANRRLFAVADTGVPDGIKVDVHGNVWTAAGDGVACHSPGGKLLGKIMVGNVSNLVFAGDVLVMLREEEVLGVRLATRGVALPGMRAPVL